MSIIAFLHLLPYSASFRSCVYDELGSECGTCKRYNIFQVDFH